MSRVPPQRAGDESPPLVLAVVGTDVHRFDRLVDWLERWYVSRFGANANGSARARLVFQYGHSRVPQLPEAVQFLAHEHLQRAMAEAAVVVSHGGPATITEARRNGHLPIVVPRNPARREHVDNHQQLFARRLGAAGMVRLCESEIDLTDALDKGIADPSAFALSSDPGAPDPRAEAVARVGQIVEDLVARAQQKAGNRRWR